jgi:hypothetical protein
METVLYKKVGRRYVEHNAYSDNLNGLPEGLYLLYKENYKKEHSAMMNMLHYVKVHSITDVGKFSDLWVAYEDKLNVAIRQGIDNWVKEKGNYSTNDLSVIVCKALSEIK